MRQRLCVALLVLLVASCRSLFGPDRPGLDVVTGESAYALDPATGTVAVDFSVMNRGDGATYVSRCGDRIMAALDRRDAGRWVQYSGDLCQAIHDMSPLAVEPGGTVQAARVVGEPGRYRLRIGASEEPGEQAAWSVVSNPFTVER